MAGMLQTYLQGGNDQCRNYATGTAGRLCFRRAYRPGMAMDQAVVMVVPVLGHRGFIVVELFGLRAAGHRRGRAFSGGDGHRDRVEI